MTSRTAPNTAHPVVTTHLVSGSSSLERQR
jgi:hypothetical protein